MTEEWEKAKDEVLDMMASEGPPYTWDDVCVAVDEMADLWRVYGDE